MSDQLDVVKPSAIIKHYEESVQVKGQSIRLTMITMARSFLVAINNHNSRVSMPNESGELSVDEMVRGFMSSNTSLDGLCLAIGDVSTCLINSESSFASQTLAIRLSKKLNDSRPVYVANNLIQSDDFDPDGFAQSLYRTIFQFVNANYKR